MPVSGRSGGGGNGGARTNREEPLVTDWLLAEISDVSHGTVGFGDHLRLLQHEWSNQQRHWSSFPGGLLPPLLNPPSSGQHGSTTNNGNGPNRRPLLALSRSPPVPDYGLYSGSARWPCPFSLSSEGTERTPGSGSDADNMVVDSDAEEGKDYSAPHSCSFLSASREFRGVQRCTKDVRSQAANHDSGDWKVNVQIQCYSPETGYICGIMEANVSLDAPVVTFWEGEIVDNINNTFITSKWQASQSTDMDNWLKFHPFRSLRDRVVKSEGQCGLLREYPYVFMRWKEKFFVSQQENSQLTIQGFYYVCMSRQDGHIWGYYYDPDSQPHQELELHACSKSHHGFGFSDYALR